MKTTDNSQDKPFWSMHLNMAASNLLTVVQFIERKFAADLEAVTADETEDGQFEDKGIERIDSSPVIKELYKPKNPNVALQAKIIETITRCLPFLREIKIYKETAHVNKKETDRNKKNIDGSQISPQDFAKMVISYATTLLDYRNFYSHHEHVSVNDGLKKRTELLFLFNNLLDINARTVKERFKYKEAPESPDQMFPLRRYKGIDRNNMQPKDNPKFACRFFETIIENKKIVIEDFTPAGLAFFIAQFLEPKYISQMFNGNELKFPKEHTQLILRAYSVTHIHLPRTRLECDEELTPETLGMDITNELHKCPHELFDMIATEKQEAFRFVDEKTHNENLAKRFDKDRFAYLALNYLDLKSKLPTLRFHIDMGNFFVAGYKKTLYDGAQINRRLAKRVYCFKRMQDAQTTYKKNKAAKDSLYWQPIEAGSKPDKPEYRVDMLPQYAIDNNNIGIAFQDYDEPDFNKHDDKNRVVFSNQKPNCWLSLYDLPSILFLVTQGKSEAVEMLIKNYYANWHKLRQDIADGKSISKDDVSANYNLTFTDLPDDVKYFILHGQTRQHPKEEVDERIKLALQKMIDGTERKLDNFKKEQDVVFKQGGFKQGKKSKQPRFKNGYMALYIARDVVRLQKPDPNEQSKHCGKITSANFQELQRSLALFDHSKDSLKQIFNQSGLTRNPEFVERLLNSSMTSLSRFFENYLISKIKFLRGFLNNPEECYVLRRLVKRHHKKRQADHLTTWLNQLANEPVNLPRGLFLGLLADLVKEKFSQQFADLQRYNSSFLIQKFHEWNGDASQWFYGLPRDPNSQTLKRLTNFLALEKMRKPNNIGIPRDIQKQLYNRWTTSPSLESLYAIEKEYNKSSSLHNGDNRQSNYERTCKKYERAVEEYENAPEHPHWKVEKLKKEADNAYDAMEAAKNLLNKPFDKKVANDETTQDEDNLSRIVRDFDNHEKDIRLSRTQDIALFYAAKDLFDARIFDGIYLKDIKEKDSKEKDIQEKDIQEKDSKEKTNLLSKQIPLSQKYRIPKTPQKHDTKSAQTIDESDKLSFTLAGTMAMKNFGNFRRIVNDIRLPSFLRLYFETTAQTSVDYAIIEKQFDEYDNGRKAIYSLVLELEKIAIKKYNLQLASKEAKDVKKTKAEKKAEEVIDFLTVLKSLKNVSEADKYLLIMYRNAFAHHKYPEFSLFDNPKVKDAAERAEYEKHFAEEQKRITSSSASLTEHVLECAKECFKKAIKNERTQ